MKPPGRVVLIFSVLGIVLGFGLAFGLFALIQASQPHQFNATMFPTPIPAKDFTLMTAGEQQVRLSDYRGKYVMIYFGYTNCPDFCPALLNEMAGAMALLGDDAEQVQLLVISVDPEQDTPDKIAEYAAFFDPSFVGLSGSLSDIQQVADNYDIFFEKEEVGSAAGYLVAHVVSSQLVGPDGLRIGSMPFGLTAEQMAADFQALIR